jgi:two-component system chemotaxis response regulator CheB
MPVNALAHVAVDAVVPATMIAETVAAIVKGEVSSSGGKRGRPATSGAGNPELTSVCPECGGVLVEKDRAGMLQWECHVGHRYSPRSLVDEQGDRVEMALWTAVRMLRDRGALLARMADHAASRGQTRSARRFRSQAEDASDQAELVLDALQRAASTMLRAVSEGEDEGHAEAEGAA